MAYPPVRDSRAGAKDPQGKIRTVAGTGKPGNSGDDGDARKATLNEPHGVTVHRDGALYVVDSFNHRVFQWVK